MLQLDPPSSNTHCNPREEAPSTDSSVGKGTGKGLLLCVPRTAPRHPWGDAELILLWFPSPLHARCFVTRQEEWEQVIQGLHGPGRGLLSWGGQGTEQGRGCPGRM